MLLEASFYLTDAAAWNWLSKNQRGLCRRARNKILQVYSSMEETNTYKRKSIIKPKSRVRIVDSSASLHTEGRKVISRRKKNIRQTQNNLEIQTANGIVRCTKKARINIQELGNYLHVKLVEDSPSEVSLTRIQRTARQDTIWPEKRPRQMRKRKHEEIAA